MTDMRQAIVPKSDQLNADDLIAGDMTITITKVDIKGGQEQPVSIHFDGDKGKPYKACKSMCRVLVSAWGPDSTKYVGRSMTLYRDASVKWAGMEVGGIRISHMSDIQGNQTMALTVTRGSKKPYTVKPLTAMDRKNLQPTATADTNHVSKSEKISDTDRRHVEAKITEVGAERDKVKKYIKKNFGKDHIGDMNRSEFEVIIDMLKNYVPPAQTVTLHPISKKIADCKTLEELEAIVEAFNTEEAVAHTKEYTARKHQFQDAADALNADAAGEGK